MKRIDVLLVAIACFYTSSCNMSDYMEKAPANYIFCYEGANLNFVLQSGKSIVDSGLIDFRYNDRYIVFSVDTSVYNQRRLNDKNKYLYYLHNIDKDTLYRNLSVIQFRNMINKLSLKELDISSEEGN